MSYHLSLPECSERLRALLAAAFLMLSVGCEPAADQTGETAPATGHGITGATTEGPDFRIPADVPEGEPWRYGLILPFQVAPETGAAFLNVRIRNGVMGTKWDTVIMKWGMTSCCSGTSARSPVNLPWC